jgi:hypothetical protein
VRIEKKKKKEEANIPKATQREVERKRGDFWRLLEDFFGDLSRETGQSWAKKT